MACDASRFWRRAGEVFVALVASYAVASGPAMVLHNADSLIPVFVSLESWTLFYWGQDRFGMLLALLAMPVRDGFWNLMVQNALTVALLLAGISCTFARLDIRYPAAGALVTLAVLLMFDSGQIPLLLLTTNQSYGPSLGLFGMAVYLLRHTTWVAQSTGAVLMLLAGWTNGGVAIFVACVALALACVGAARHAALPVLAGAAASLAVHAGLQRLARGPLVYVTSMATPAVGAMPSLVWAFWADAVRLIGAPFWVSMAMAWIAAAAIAIRRDVAGRPLVLLCSVGLASFAYGSAMAVFFYGLGRHIAPAIPLIVMCPLIVIVRSFPARAHWAWLSVGLLVVIVLQTGVAWPRQVRRDLVARLGQGRAETLYIHGVRAVTGDYWLVWPLTFAINLLHEDHHGQRPVLPVTRRAERLLRDRRAEVKAHAKVGIVPARDLRYWRRARLPRLRVDWEFTDYALATVRARNEGAR